MLVIPAIDLIDGACVRLTEGKYNRKKEYSDDPLSVAENWKRCGARWLHIIDLDGARTGILRNLDIAVSIKKKTGLKVQYGGGIRSLEILESVINRGIDRAILGTVAFEDKEFLRNAVEIAGNRCILSVDFDSDGVIYKHGWQKETQLDVFTFLPGLKEYDFHQIIVTNISRDGTLKGLDMEIIKKILVISPFKLIIAGGISRDEDIFKLKELENKGISGVIIGKALYEKKIDLRSIISQEQGRI